MARKDEHTLSLLCDGPRTDPRLDGRYLKGRYYIERVRSKTDGHRGPFDCRDHPVPAVFNYTSAKLKEAVQRASSARRDDPRSEMVVCAAYKRCGTRDIAAMFAYRLTGRSLVRGRIKRVHSRLANALIGEPLMLGANSCHVASRCPSRLVHWR